MSSSLFGNLSGAAKGGLGGFGGLGADILMRAAGAMMRGESPQKFVKNLAKTHPAFRQINADDLENEAHRLCKERGVDEGELAKQIRQYISKL